MAARDYTLDFSGQSGVPSQWGIDQHQVAKWFGQQAKGIHGIQVTGNWKRGFFSVSAINDEAATFLSSFKLVAEKYGQKIEIPLRQTRKRLKPAVWVNIRRTCEGRMSDLPNVYFDEYIEGFGHTIVEPTQRGTYRNSIILNGSRRVMVELGDTHLPRQDYWRGEEHPDESQEWIMTYKGQPFKCRKCNDTWHADGNCPKRVEKSQMEKREGQ